MQKFANEDTPAAQSSFDHFGSVTITLFLRLWLSVEAGLSLVSWAVGGHSCFSLYTTVSSRSAQQLAFQPQPSAFFSCCAKAKTAET